MSVNVVLYFDIYICTNIRHLQSMFDYTVSTKFGLVLAAYMTQFVAGWFTCSNRVL